MDYRTKRRKNNFAYTFPDREKGADNHPFSGLWQAML